MKSVQSITWKHHRGLRTSQTFEFTAQHNVEHTAITPFNNHNNRNRALKPILHARLANMQALRSKELTDPTKGFIWKGRLRQLTG